MDLLKIIDKIAKILNSSDIKEIKIKDIGSSIFMTKNNKYSIQNIVSKTPFNSNLITKDLTTSSINNATFNNCSDKIKNINKEEYGEEIKSPMVGTFYRASSPESIAYVNEGQEVKRGDILCIIEAMKIMNKIEAERSGKIIKIIAKDGESVQYDQPLFIIK